MTTKLLTYFALFFTISQAYGEQAPYAMHEFLLKSTLVVKAKITSHSMQHFKVQVKDVVYDQQWGIQKGDYLNIQHDFQVVCPGIPISHTEKKETVFIFLHKRGHKWNIVQHVISFEREQKFKINFSEEGCSLTMSAEEWKRQIRAYRKEFYLNEKENPVGKLSKEEFRDANLPNIVALQYMHIYRDYSYHKLHRDLCVSEWIEAEPEEDLSIYTNATHTPFTTSRMDSLQLAFHQFLTSKFPDYTHEEKYYPAEIILEKSGKISSVQLVRPVAEKMREGITSFLQTISWPPALNEKNEPIRFRTSIVLVVKENKDGNIDQE